MFGAFFVFAGQRVGAPSARGDRSRIARADGVRDRASIVDHRACRPNPGIGPRAHR